MLLASGDYFGSVEIWDPAARQQRTVLYGHWADVNALCPVTVAGQDLLASASDDKTVRIWDPATGQQRAILEGHHGPVRSVCAVTVAGQDLLASASDDKTVRIWDPATGRVQALMRAEKPFFACTQIGAGGLAVGGASGLYAFDYLPDVTPQHFKDLT